MDILNEIDKIFREFFDDEALAINRETSRDNLEEWDSLAHLNLIIIIEKHFGVKFMIDEIPEIRSIGEIVDLIKAKS